VVDRSIKILFAAGGTGGHLFPALAIADELKKLKPDAGILFVGTKSKIESSVVPEKGYEFRTIWISGFHRGFRLSNLLFPFKVLVALIQSFFVIRTFRPEIVIGTGSYVAGPVLWVASLLGIPTVLHESNSYPGVTTRLLARRASRVFIAFEMTKKWLQRVDNVELVGNPTRDLLGTVPREMGTRFFNLNPAKKTLLVFGGSSGASSLNKAIAGIVNELVDAGIQVIWQVGEKEFEKMTSRQELAVEKVSHARSVWVGKFIKEIEYAYAAADLVMCRSGATTLAELTRLGKPAILVPYPHAAANHQGVNALAMVEHEAAEMVLDRELSTRAKEIIIRLISDDEKLKHMSKQSLKLGKPEAGRQVAEKILTMIPR